MLNWFRDKSYKPQIQQILNAAHDGNICGFTRCVLNGHTLWNTNGSVPQLKRSWRRPGDHSVRAAEVAVYSLLLSCAAVNAVKTLKEEFTNFIPPQQPEEELCSARETRGEPVISAPEHWQHICTCYDAALIPVKLCCVVLYCMMCESSCVGSGTPQRLMLLALRGDWIPLEQKIKTLDKRDPEVLQIDEVRDIFHKCTFILVFFFKLFVCLGFYCILIVQTNDAGFPHKNSFNSTEIFLQWLAAGDFSWCIKVYTKLWV